MTRPAPGVLILRALRLRCPRCGEGKMFTGLFRMNETCPHCRHRFEREPGYFLGSIYINYGLTAALTVAAYITLRFGYGIEARKVAWGLLAFVVLFGVFFHRYARALWVAMDCRFDRSLFEDRDDEVPQGRRD
jgi:uncharacterized protein (DUF983 family)